MKKIITMILCVLMSASVFAVGCGGENPEVELVEGQTYSNEIGKYENTSLYGAVYEEVKTNYDNTLFYTNQARLGGVADPCVVYDRDPLSPTYGNFFLISGMSGGHCAYKSKDMVTWEYYGEIYRPSEGGWQNADYWAPEMIYDDTVTPEDYGMLSDSQYRNENGEVVKKQGMWFLVYSNTPLNTITLNGDPIYAYGTNMRNYYHEFALAYAKHPYGPFYDFGVHYSFKEDGAMIDGVDYGSHEGFINSPYVDAEALLENNHQDIYDGARSRTVGGVAVDGVDVDDIHFNFAAARAKIAYDKKKNEAAGWNSETNTYNNYSVDDPSTWYNYYEDGYHFTVIDASPFLDPSTGMKYVVIRNRNYGMDYDKEGKRYVFGTPDYLLPCVVYNKDNGAIIETDYYGNLVNQDDIDYFEETYGETVTKFDSEYMYQRWEQFDYNKMTYMSRPDYNFMSTAAENAYKTMANPANGYYDKNAFEEGVDETEWLDLRYFKFGLNDGENWLGSGVSMYWNEGPQLVYNKKSGLYYFSYSTNGTSNVNYSVLQAVAYSVFGPYRKLSIAEGGILSYANATEDIDNITAPGHHFMFHMNDDWFIFYHRAPQEGGSRFTNVDRLQWIRNGYGMYIPHMNGPSTSIQPRMYGIGTNYDNIAPEATVTATNASDVKRLTDKVLLFHDLTSPWAETRSRETYTERGYVYDYARAGYVKECEFESGETTITLTFDQYRTVTALMVYNSKHASKMFTEVKKVEMQVEKNGVQGTYVINNLAFNMEGACSYRTKTQINLLRPGNAAIARFAPVSVKSITITVEKSAKATTLAIPEIVVLGTK